MTHEPIYWARKLPHDRLGVFWKLIAAGFGGETAYHRTIDRIYG
jgi:hypothetical protein